MNRNLIENGHGNIWQFKTGRFAFLPKTIHLLQVIHIFFPGYSTIWNISVARVTGKHGKSTSSSMIFPATSIKMVDFPWFPTYVPMIFQLFMGYFPLPEAFDFRQARLAQDYAQKLRSYALWRRQKPVDLVDRNDIWFIWLRYPLVI